MKALTLTQPWAALVARGIKLVENRSWKPPRRMLGEQFAIHASREIDRDAWRRIIEIDPTTALDYPGPMEPRARLHRLAAVTSAIIGVATLDHYVFDETGLLTSDIAHELGAQQRWYFGPVGFVLRDVKALAEPVPCRGSLSFWTVPGPVAARVEAQLR